MAKLSGKSGTVSIGGSIYGVTQWTFKPELAAVEVTGMEDGGYRTYVPGLNGASLTARGHHDSGTAVVSLKGGTLVAFALTSDAGNQISLAGSAIITSVNYESSVDGAVDFTCEATVSGSWTETAI